MKRLNDEEKNNNNTGYHDQSMTKEANRIAYMRDGLVVQKGREGKMKIRYILICF